MKDNPLSRRVTCAGVSVSSVERLRTLELGLLCSRVGECGSEVWGVCDSGTLVWVLG